MSGCTHTETVSGEWVEVYRPTETGENENDWEWQVGGEIDTVEDVDLHHYRCTQCGAVFCY